MLMTSDNLNFIDFKVSSLSSGAPGIYFFIHNLFSLIYNSFDEIQLQYGGNSYNSIMNLMID